jgi:hypothetical protein
LTPASEGSEPIPDFVTLNGLYSATLNGAVPPVVRLGEPVVVLEGVRVRDAVVDVVAVLAAV